MLPHKEPPALGLPGISFYHHKLDSVNIHQQVIKTSNMYWHERCRTGKFEEKCRLRLHWTGCSRCLTLHQTECSPGSRPCVGQILSRVCALTQAVTQKPSLLLPLTHPRSRKEEKIRQWARQARDSHNFTHILLLSRI